MIKITNAHHASTTVTRHNQLSRQLVFNYLVAAEASRVVVVAAAVDELRVLVPQGREILAAGDTLEDDGVSGGLRVQLLDHLLGFRPVWDCVRAHVGGC